LFATSLCPGLIFSGDPSIPLYWNPAAATPVLVDSSYQRYFMHKRDRTYVGGEMGMDLDTLQ
jgi:hypothetical protein